MIIVQYLHILNETLKNTIDDDKRKDTSLKLYFKKKRLEVCSFNVQIWL